MREAFVVTGTILMEAWKAVADKSSGSW